MDNKNESFEDDDIFVRFFLYNNDTITFSGKSVEEIFFEVYSKFPYSFPFRSIAFSSKTPEYSQECSQKYFELAKNFGKL